MIISAAPSPAMSLLQPLLVLSQLGFLKTRCLISAAHNYQVVQLSNGAEVTYLWPHPRPHPQRRVTLPDQLLSTANVPQLGVGPRPALPHASIHPLGLLPK